MKYRLLKEAALQELMEDFGTPYDELKERVKAEDMSAMEEWIQTHPNGIYTDSESRALNKFVASRMGVWWDEKSPMDWVMRRESEEKRTGRPMNPNVKTGSLADKTSDLAELEGSSIYNPYDSAKNPLTDRMS